MGTVIEYPPTPVGHAHERDSIGTFVHPLFITSTARVIERGNGQPQTIIVEQLPTVDGKTDFVAVSIGQDRVYVRTMIEREDLLALLGLRETIERAREALLRGTNDDEHDALNALLDELDA